MRILSIDPGLARTGYAVFEFENKKPVLLKYEAIITKGSTELKNRLKYVYDSIMDVIQKNGIDQIALEKLYFSKNVKTAFKVGYTRGIVMLLAAQNQIPVFEYTPQQVKSSIGYGNAGKEQVQKMVKKLFNIQCEKMLYDISDAIALGFCHINSLEFTRIMERSEGK